MKIQIIGPSGAGKTTLGKYVSEQLNINFIDTDSYYWKDIKNKIPNSISEREKIFLKDLQKDKNNWVVSGSIFSWNKVHLMDRDIIVYLSIDEEVRIKRLTDRFNQTIDTYKFDPNFLNWAKTYYTETDSSKGGTHVAHMAELEIIKNNTNSTIIYLNGEDKIENNFKKIEKM